MEIGAILLLVAATFITSIGIYWLAAESANDKKIAKLAITFIQLSNGHVVFRVRNTGSRDPAYGVTLRVNGTEWGLWKDGAQDKPLDYSPPAVERDSLPPHGYTDYMLSTAGLPPVDSYTVRALWRETEYLLAYTEEKFYTNRFDTISKQKE